MRRRHGAILAALATLFAVIVTVALHGLGDSPVAYTLSLGQAQSRDLAIADLDAAHGQLYVAVDGTAWHDTIQVFDIAGRRWHALAAATAASLSLAVVPRADRVLLVRSSLSRQQTQLEVLSAGHATVLHTLTLPLSASYLPQALVVRAGLAAAVSSGDELCTATRAGAQRCTVSGSGVALVETATGRLRHILSVPGRAWAVGFDAGAAHILVTSSTGSGALGSSRLVVSVFDARTGRLRRRAMFTTPTLTVQHLAVDVATERAFLLATVNAGPRPSQPLHSYLYVLDLRSGALLHTLTLAGAAGDVAVDVRSRRVFVSETGLERLIWKTVAGGGLGAFVPIGRGALHLLDARTGAPLATIPLGIAPSAIAVDERRNRVYIVNAGSHDAYGAVGSSPIVIPAPLSGPGGLSVVNATTGHLLRVVALGTQPTSIALDAFTQQAFIGDTGDGAPHPLVDRWGWLPRPVRRFLAFLPQRVPASRPLPARVIVVDTSRL